jgi:hypothetical protein
MKHENLFMHKSGETNWLVKSVKDFPKGKVLEQVICEFNPIPEAEEYAEEFMKLHNKFPNGFASWRETFFEVTCAIRDEHKKNFPKGKVKDYHTEGGTCALYNLAEELTDEFEVLNKGREWDGEFFDEIEAFCKTKLYK